MKIILTQEVSGLGTPGDVVEVKDGFGRNYLLPQGFAIPCDNCGIFGSQDVTCSLQPCKGSAGDVLVSPNSSTVRAATRTGKNFGKSHLPSLDPLARSHGNGRTLTISFPESQSPFTIATCWQFDCRAAHHPRAPTLVS